MTYQQCKDNFALNLKWWLDYRGMSQQKLANACELPKSTMSRYALGVCLPNVQHLMKIADVLGCSMEDLLQ